MTTGRPSACTTSKGRRKTWLRALNCGAELPQGARENQKEKRRWKKEWRREKTHQHKCKLVSTIHRRRDLRTSPRLLAPSHSRLSSIEIFSLLDRLRNIHTLLSLSKGQEEWIELTSNWLPHAAVRCMSSQYFTYCSSFSTSSMKGMKSSIFERIKSAARLRSCWTDWDTPPLLIWCAIAAYMLYKETNDY